MLTSVATARQDLILHLEQIVGTLPSSEGLLVDPPENGGDLRAAPITW
jgi:hypothetical protein